MITSVLPGRSNMKEIAQLMTPEWRPIQPKPIPTFKSVEQAAWLLLMTPEYFPIQPMLKNMTVQYCWLLHPKMPYSIWTLNADPAVRSLHEI